MAYAISTMTSLYGTIGGLVGFAGWFATVRGAEWPAWLAWEHVVGHMMVWIGFVAIAAILWYVDLRKPTFVRNRGLVRSVTLFIALCGLVHLLELLAFYHPVDWLTGHLLVITGLASWYALWRLWRIRPKLTSSKGAVEFEQEAAARTRELNAAVAELKALIECVPNVVWTADSTGTLDSMNRRWGELTGIVSGPDAIVWEPGIHPDDLKPSRDMWLQAVSAGAPYECEVRFLDQRTGLYRWHLVRALPLHVEGNGKTVRWVGTATDIQDQKQAEEALLRNEAELEVRVRERTEELAKINASLQAELHERRKIERALGESERRFRAIFDHTFQFVGIATPDGIVTEANQTVLTMGGLKREEVVGIPCWETPWNHSQQSRDRLKAVIARAAAGEFVRYEGALRGPNNTLTPIDFSVTPLRDESGQISMLIMEGRDITAQKEAAEALRQSEERFRGAFDAAAIGMALVIPTGRFLQVNRSLRTMLGYSEQELLDRLDRLIPPGRPQREREYPGRE